MDRKRKSVSAGPATTVNGVREDSRIFVHVIEAKNVPRKKKKDGPVSTFVTVTIGGKSARSNPIKSSAPPSWDYECEFFNLHPYFDALVIGVYYNGRFRNTLLAEATIPRDTLKPDECEQQDWYAMVAKVPHTGEQPRVRLKYTFTKETILPLNEYEKLLLLLQNPDLEAVTALSATSLNMVEVSRTLIRVMEGTDSAIRFLKNVTSHEINSTSDPNVIFRSNSIAAKSVDAYMKLMGIPYLQKVLRAPMKKIFADTRSCEVDEAKMGADKGDVKRNAAVLLSHVENLTTSIFDSADDCPMPMRVVFNHIQKEAVRHFPSSDVIRFTSVTAFIFLRFFCPAILAPKKFGILELDPPDAKKKRTLLLVSKTLQNLANLAAFGWKEEGMPIETMNEFLNGNKDKMKDFVRMISSSENIIDVDSGASTRKRSRNRSLTRRPDRGISMGIMDIPEIDLERELAAIFRHLVRTRVDLEKYVAQHAKAQPLLDVVNELEQRHSSTSVLSRAPSTSVVNPSGISRNRFSLRLGGGAGHSSSSASAGGSDDKQQLVTQSPDILDNVKGKDGAELRSVDSLRRAASLKDALGTTAAKTPVALSTTAPSSSGPSTSSASTSAAARDVAVVPTLSVAGVEDVSTAASIGDKPVEEEGGTRDVTGTATPLLDAIPKSLSVSVAALATASSNDQLLPTTV